MESLTLFVFPLPLPMQLSGIVLDRPKSQIFTWQFLLMRMFDGFISRWTTLAECRYFRAHKLLYKIVLRWSWENPDFWPIYIRAFMSVSMCSIIINMFFISVLISSCGISKSMSSGIKQQKELLPLLLDNSCIPFIIYISRTTLTQLYSCSEKSDISLMATSLPETQHIALTTWPKLPWPTFSIRVYPASMTVIHRLLSLNDSNLLMLASY